MTIVSRSLLPILILLTPTLTFAHGVTEGAKSMMIAGGNFEYFQLGALHMLSGYDHLLFIFGVIFLLSGFKDIFKYITAFTLGHSITLVLATVFGITVNYYLIDAVIALSVCYKGFENLDGFKKHFGVTAPNILAVIFVFGLIHGFGLSTRLQQLPLGDDGLIMRILSFNAGVEVGQVAALSLMLLVIAGWRRVTFFKSFAVYSNRGLIGAGLVLLVFQLHGFGHSVNLNLLGFETAAQASSLPSGQNGSAALQEVLGRYDKAFVERDLMALWDMFSENIILYEQGGQDIGRDNALGKHIGPDLTAFIQMAANFSNTHLLEFDGTAVRTRQFDVMGKLPNRLFRSRGLETQNWAFQNGKWKLVHMHWSFPGR